MRFILDDRLSRSSNLICRLELCQVRLVDDKRWPWLMLVPERADLRDWHDLEAEDLMLAAVETAHCGQVLKAFTQADKINTAAIGNMVAQLHIHVVARRQDDPNWPGPIWGYGDPVARETNERDDLIGELARSLEGSSLAMKGQR